MTAVKYGGNLESREAGGGTVRLIVDHDEELYAVEMDNIIDYFDELEILTYLYDHGFELMDEDECPADIRDGFTVYWACHSEGQTFQSQSELAASEVAC